MIFYVWFTKLGQAKPKKGIACPNLPNLPLKLIGLEVLERADGFRVVGFAY